MTLLLQLKNQSRIARRGEQGARPAIPTQAVVEKISTEEKKKKNIILLKASKRIKIRTLNTQTL